MFPQIATQRDTAASDTVEQSMRLANLFYAQYDWPRRSLCPVDCCSARPSSAPPDYNRGFESLSVRHDVISNAA